MNWKNIEQYDKELCEMLLRIEAYNGDVWYIVGDIDSNGSIYTHTDFDGTFDGFLCNREHMSKKGIKSIHYIDPREILL